MRCPLPRACASFGCSRDRRRAATRRHLRLRLRLGCAIHTKQHGMLHDDCRRPRSSRPACHGQCCGGDSDGSQLRAAALPPHRPLEHAHCCTSCVSNARDSDRDPRSRVIARSTIARTSPNWNLAVSLATPHQALVSWAAFPQSKVIYYSARMPASYTRRGR
jgi:hypothetical protein